MAKKEKASRKKRSKFRYFVIFLFFIAIGVGVGVFGTSKYLDYINNEEDNSVLEEAITDITDNDNYNELVNSLLNVLDKDPIFYSTKGVKADTLDNTSRLKIIYKHIVNKEMDTKEVLTPYYYGASSCYNGIFKVDSVMDPTAVTTIGCTINKISTSLFGDVNTQLFDDDILDTSVGFDVDETTKCILEDSNYLCGATNAVATYTGKLESKFEIVKVTKDISGTIVIYEKGYLQDKRSNVDNLTDQYDNYYLHSSDSTDYYYELKSADNLTFKHTFKTKDRENYYYVSTELVEE